MRYHVKRIPLWPVMRVAFVVMLIIGIVIGIFYGFLVSGLGMIMGALGESALGEGFPSIGNLGFLMVPFIAVFYAVTGTIVIVIWVLIYNIVAQVLGGIELELSAGDERGELPEPHVPERPLEGF